MSLSVLLLLSIAQKIRHCVVVNVLSVPCCVRNVKNKVLSGHNKVLSCCVVSLVARQKDISGIVRQYWC